MAGTLGARDSDLPKFTVSSLNSHLPELIQADGLKGPQWRWDGKPRISADQTCRTSQSNGRVTLDVSLEDQTDFTQRLSFFFFNS